MTEIDEALKVMAKYITFNDDKTAVRMLKGDAWTPQSMWTRAWIPCADIPTYQNNGWIFTNT